MSERRSIDPVDNMWLNMDQPNNLMVIDGVMWFDETIDLDRLAPLLQRRLIDRYPVFSQRPVASAIPFGASHWEDDPDFDLSHHLRRVTLPAPGSQDDLQRYVEGRMSVPFDHARPMWEMTLVEGYGSGCALLSRFHHCLADGMALAQVILSLTDATAEVDLEETDEGKTDQDKGAGRSPQQAGGLLGAARLLVDTGAQALHGGRRALSMLPGLVPSLSLPKDVLELGWKTGRIADKLILGDNPPAPFRGEPGVEKRAVWSGPRSIRDIKTVCRLTGATVNDVLVAAVSGAINTYLHDLGAEPVDVTTMIPVNVRNPGEPLPRELGNKFALVYLKLPSGVSPSLQRVAESKQRMDVIKGSPEAFLTFTLNKAIGLLDRHLSSSITSFFSDKAIGVTTNVIGPQTQRYVAGVPIAGAVSWVPGSGQQTLGVCIFSLAGIVRVGFKVDAATLPNPEKLVHAFDEDLDELLRIAAKAG